MPAFTHCSCLPARHSLPLVCAGRKRFSGSLQLVQDKLGTVFHVLVSHEANVELVSMVLQEAPSPRELLETKDADGHVPRDLAKKNIRALIDDVMLFCARFDIRGKRPQHTSETCKVFVTTDSSTEEQVAVKFMSFKDQARIRCHALTRCPVVLSQDDRCRVILMPLAFLKSV